MNAREMTDADLLVRLLGKRHAAKLAGRSLVSLFQPLDGEDAVAPKLQVAHELIRRWLGAKLRDTPAYENPAAIRLFLSAHMRSRTYEC